MTAQPPSSFWPWLKHNHHIYSEFVRIAKSKQRAGRERYSAKVIVEHIRWSTPLAQSHHREFKVDNTMTSGMARQAMLDHAELEGFFEVRGDG